jgi:hypothetical protein
MVTGHALFVSGPELTGNTVQHYPKAQQRGVGLLPSRGHMGRGESIAKPTSCGMPHRRFELMGLPQSTGVTEPCVRCRAKGIVVCPECQGTGDIRNESYVVVDRCHICLKEWRGFITCPSCLGKKAVDSSQLRRSYRLERERMRIVPSIWGYENPASLLSYPLSPRRSQGAEVVECCRGERITLEDDDLELAGGHRQHHLTARAPRPSVAKAPEYWKMAKHYHVKGIKLG